MGIRGGFMAVAAMWTRRGVLAAGAAAGAARAVAARPLYAYVGCYTSAKRYARGDGIHVFRVDEATGK